MSTVTVPKKGGFVPYPKPEVIPEPERIPVKRPAPQPKGA